MTDAADFTVEVRDRDFVRLGQIAPEYMDVKFVDVHNGVGSWELKLPAEHPLLPALKTKGSGIVITEHWMTGSTHNYRVFSGRMRTARLSQNAEDPIGTWIVNGVDDNVIAAASVIYPDPANLASAQTAAYWVQSGTAETIMKLAVQANIGSTAIASRKYPWLTIATNLLRGGAVQCSSRFDVMGDLLSSLGTAANLGWEFRQQGNGVVFDVYTPANKTGEVRLDVRNGGLESSELGFTAPSATQVLVMGQGEGASRTIQVETSAAATTEATNWGIRWELTKDQRNTNVAAELTQAGQEILTENGSTVNSLKVVPSDSPGMALGRDWYRGDKITVVVEGVEATSVCTQVAVSISAAGVIRQATIGDPVGFDYDAKISSKVKDVEQRVGAVERLVGQGAQWSDIGGIPAGITADSGDVKATSRRTPPAGWLVASGQAVSRATYGPLFQATNELVGTFTVTIAAPAVVTLTAHGLQTGQQVYLTTTGALPTGLAANTNYWVIWVSANTFRLATSLANAQAGTAITTTGTQSGTHSVRTTYGVGDGSTTFNVPNLNGRVIAGVDATQPEFAATGLPVGAKVQLIDSGHLPVGVVLYGGGTAYYTGITAGNSGNAYAAKTHFSPAQTQTAMPMLQPTIAMTYIIKT